MAQTRFIQTDECREFLADALRVAGERTGIAGDKLKIGRAMRETRARALFILGCRRCSNVSLPMMAWWLGCDHSALVHLTQRHDCDPVLPIIAAELRARWPLSPAFRAVGEVARQERMRLRLDATAHTHADRRHRTETATCPECACPRIRPLRSQPGWCFCIECNAEFPQSAAPGCDIQASRAGDVVCSGATA